MDNSYLNILKANIFLNSTNGRPECATSDDLRIAAMKVKLFTRRFEDAVIEAGRQSLEACEEITGESLTLATGQSE